MTCQPIGSKNSPFRHIQFVPEGKISNLGPLGLDPHAPPPRIEHQQQNPTGAPSSTTFREGVATTDRTSRALYGHPGRAQESDGKSAAGRRGISLDSFTCAKLRELLDLLASERRKFGKDYPSHGLLMVNELRRPLHPDTITTRFNRLVDRAGVPRIRLHDVRHTYATLAMDEGVDPKTLSDRLGHANTSVTLQIYTHRSHGRDTVMAQALGELIQSALTPEDPHESPVVRKLVRNHPANDSGTTMKGKSTED